MSRPVRIVLLGNSFASRIQLPALRWAGGNEVVGIAGRDPDKARATAAEWGIPHATGDWRELLALEPDLVIVTTPVHLHAEMVRAALETPAAILCEKPFTLDADEAAPLVEAARGRLALLDHQLRWSPWRRRLRELVAEGFVGTPWNVRTEISIGSVRRRDASWSWWYDAACGGGALGATSSHLVDLVRHGVGEVAAVLGCRLERYVPERRDADGVAHAVTADEHAIAWLELAGGARATVESNLMAPGGLGLRTEVIGSEGTLVLEGEERLFGLRATDDLAPIEVAPAPTFAETGMPEAGPFARILPLYLRDVVAAVAAGATELPGAATFADGLATMRVLDAARRVAVRGEREVVGP